MSKLLHFNSNIPFSLYINGEYVDKCYKDNSLDILLNTKELIYTICPFSNGEYYLVDNGKISILNDNITSSSELIEVVPYKNNHYDIKYISSQIYNSSYSLVLTQEEFGNIVANIFNDGKGVVEILDKGRLKLRKNLSPIDTAQVDFINEKLIIKCLLKNKSFYITVINCKTFEIVFESICDSVEFSQVKIKTLKLCNDISNHEIVQELDLKDNAKQEYTIYVRKTKNMCNDRLLPMQFLQSIKANDYVMAKKCLTESFKDITKEQLKNYFGDIRDIYYNC